MYALFISNALLFYTNIIQLCDLKLRPLGILTENQNNQTLVCELVAAVRGSSLNYYSIPVHWWDIVSGKYST